MNDELQQAFYSVMYKYKLPFTEQGVRANLEQWQTAKAGLLELLRRHPNWREEELAIVFDISEQREIDHDRVDEAKFELALLAEEMQMPQHKRDCFTRALDAATADYATVPSDARVSEVARIGGIKCGSGMKASRIINRLSLHFGLDTFETEKLCGAPGHQELRRVHPYQAAFARLADALNPVTLTKRGVLSVHPCDFLEMSNRDNSWRSCHRLNGGSFRAGCQSYMGDPVSMIFFTVDDEWQSTFYQAPRLTREIFCYHDGQLLQSRLYPVEDGAIRDSYRKLVQQAVARCLGEANLWTVKRDRKELNGYWTTREGSLHYQDYDHGYGILSLLKGRQAHEPFVIGSPSLCTCCGQPQNTSSSLKCSSCEETVLCKSCGRQMEQVLALYLESRQGYYCSDCAKLCYSCRTRFLDTAYPAFDRVGKPRIVCGSCYERAVRVCHTCAIRRFCRSIKGAFCCPHIENGLMADEEGTQE